MIRPNKFRVSSSFFLYLVIFITLSSCKFKEDKKESLLPDNLRELEFKITNDETGKILAKADSILTQLTLEERVGQCLMPSINSSSDPATLKYAKKIIEDYHVGGFVLLKGNLSSVKILSGLGRDSKIPLFIAIDAEWGLGMRLSDARVYPKNGNLSKTLEDTELFDYGNTIATECRETGINMVLGPVIDIVSRGNNIIGNRSFGDDPNLVADYGVSYAKGLESGGVISVAKHFPGHGSTIIDSHRGIARIDKEISDLDSIDLKPFKEYINSGLTGIMAGHIESKALDPDGKAASVSMDILTLFLREELGFKGLILTDAFDMGGAKGFSAVDALRAGADIVLCPKDIKKEYYSIIKALETGELDFSVVNDRCKRILFVKILFGIL